MNWLLLLFIFHKISNVIYGEEFGGDSRNVNFHYTFDNKINITNIHRRLQRYKTWENHNISSYIHYEKTNRTAVILTGQLRSANITWTSGKIHSNPASKMFGGDDPFTTASTIIEWLLKPIARESGIDVFMYQTANPLFKDVPWDGDPFTYETKLGDYTGCRVFADNPLFHNTGNKFFCLIEPEIELMTPFIANFSMWDSCSHRDYKEQVLQQLYGIYRANIGVKQYMLSNNIHYKYKVRLRPDTAVVKEFPRLSEINFTPSADDHCIGIIRYANKIIYRNGNQDWFNIGLAEHMDPLLDRYVDFTTTPFIHDSTKGYWDLEDHLTGLMRLRYNTCIAPWNDIWMVVIRKEHHQTINSWHLDHNPLQWEDLSS